jgi:predicted permease
MSWLSRLKNAVNSDRLEDDLADEMRDHMERHTATLIERGVAPVEARRQAALRFGNATRLKEEGREIRLWAALETTIQDAGYAWRAMWNAPAFTATAVLSLGLAIGANTAIYSIVDAAMLRSLPVPDPQQLITLATPDIQQAGSQTTGERESFSYPTYLGFREAAGRSARLALFGYPSLEEVRESGAGAPLEKITQQYVSGDSFDILGVSPALGRVFSSEDDRVPGGHPEAVLSYEYWQRRFGGDPNIPGRTIGLQGKVFRIVGVARQGFFGVEPGKFVDIWLPAMMYEKRAFNNPGWRWFRILGRVSPGETRERLTARLQPVLTRANENLVKQVPTMPETIRLQIVNSELRVHPGANGVSGFRRDFTKPLWIIFGVAIGILWIACANVASLLLSRSTARSAEMAMRVSLGAGRGRLIRQLLTESLLLSTLAGALGWLMARVVAPALVVAVSKEGEPVQFALAMDSRVLFFCIGVSTVAAVLFGLLPAWQASSTQPMAGLRGNAGRGGKLRLGRFMVAMQVAFAFCLMIAGAGFLFSLKNLLSVNAGFDPRDVTVINIGTEAAKQPEPFQRQLIEQLERRVGAQPAIQSVAVASWPILVGTGWTSQILMPGRAPSEREEIFYRVSPAYFETMRTQLVAGRTFEPYDSEARNPSPAIVNQALARNYFGDTSPVGKEFERLEGNKPARLLVVGVAANAHYTDLRQSAEPIVYLPLEGTSSFSLYVRSKGDAGSLLRLIERESESIGSGMRVRDIATLETLVGNTLLREKLLAGLGGAFAVLGLFLAAIGLFGILNYSVVRRTKEIGIRAALGAQSTGLIVLVMKDLVALVGGGLIAGLAGSLVVMQTVQSLLFGLHRIDTLVIGTATVAFLVATIVAGGLPAHRAATVDPMMALRHE